MPFKCPSGTKKGFRFRKIRGGIQRIGGCMLQGQFVQIKEVKNFRGKKVEVKKIGGVRKRG